MLSVSFDSCPGMCCNVLTLLETHGTQAQVPGCVNVDTLFEVTTAFTRGRLKAVFETKAFFIYGCCNGRVVECQFSR